GAARSPGGGGLRDVHAARAGRRGEPARDRARRRERGPLAGGDRGRAGEVAGGAGERRRAGGSGRGAPAGAARGAREPAPQRGAGAIAEWNAFAGEADFLAGEEQRLREVTAERLAATVKAWLAKEAAVTVVVRPAKGRKRRGIESDGVQLPPRHGGQR